MRRKYGSDIKLEVSTRGQIIPVSVDSEGKFSAEVDGVIEVRDTFDKLKQFIQSAVSKKKVKIPIYRIEVSYTNKLQLSPGYCVGKHSNGNLLLRFDDGKSIGRVEQKGRWGQDILRNLSLAERAKIIGLYGAKKKASDLYEEFLKSLYFTYPGNSADSDLEDS